VAAEKRYTAQTVKCHACAAKDRKGRILREGDSPAAGDGTYIVVVEDDPADDD
jgi:hypothetical protein